MNFFPIQQSLTLASCSLEEKIIKPLSSQQKKVMLVA
jgi:hypothetical protein